MPESPVKKRMRNAPKTFKEKLPPRARVVLGSMLHQVPEASSTCQLLLGLGGTREDYIANVRSYARLSPQAKRMYDLGAVACALARRLLKSGRGNVAADVRASHGISRASVTQKRHGYTADPSFHHVGIAGKPVTEFTSTELSVMRSIFAGAGNCGEFANTAYAYLRTQLLLEGTQIFRCSNKEQDHAFLVIAVANGHHTPTLLICDPWINFIGTANQAKVTVAHLVNFSIYQPALTLVTDCLRTHKTEETLSRAGKQICRVTQPAINLNVFTLPAIEATVGPLAEEHQSHAPQFAQRAASASALAEHDIAAHQADPEAKTRLYVLDEHDFPRGDASEIPKITP